MKQLTKHLTMPGRQQKRPNNNTQEKKQNNPVAILQHDEPLLPGETVTLFMNFSDDEMKGPVTIQLQKTDLKGPLNEKITAGNISIKPSAVTIKPGENKEVAVHIKI